MPALLHSLILPPPPILLLTPTPFLALSGYWLYFLLAIAFSVSSLISFSLASSPFPPPSQAAPENMLIRAQVKSSERVYFPDEIKQHNSLEFSFTLPAFCSNPPISVNLAHLVAPFSTATVFSPGPATTESSHLAKLFILHAFHPLFI